VSVTHRITGGILLTVRYIRVLRPKGDHEALHQNMRDVKCDGGGGDDDDDIDD